MEPQNLGGSQPVLRLNADPALPKTATAAGEPSASSATRGRTGDHPVPLTRYDTVAERRCCAYLMGDDSIPDVV